jgi:hypothetical protein
MRNVCLSTHERDVQMLYDLVREDSDQIVDLRQRVHGNVCRQGL